MLKAVKGAPFECDGCFLEGVDDCMNVSDALIAAGLPNCLGTGEIYVIEKVVDDAGRTE